MAWPRTLRVRVPPGVDQVQVSGGRLLIADGANIITIDPANYPYDLDVLRAVGGVPSPGAVLTNGCDLVNGTGMLTAVSVLGL